MVKKGIYYTGHSTGNAKNKNARTPLISMFYVTCNKKKYMINYSSDMLPS